MKTWIQPFCLILLEHYRVYQTSQPTIPRKILQQVQQYKTQVDDVQQFIDEHLVVDPESSVIWSDLLQSYNQSYNQYKNVDLKLRSKEANLLRNQLINKYFKND
jgi:hypothetical protein